MQRCPRLEATAGEAGLQHGREPVPFPVGGFVGVAMFEPAVDVGGHLARVRRGRGEGLAAAVGDDHEVQPDPHVDDLLHVGELGEPLVVHRPAEQDEASEL